MKYGLIGEKLSHSFSPLIHSKIGNYPYELKEIAKQDIEKFFLKRDFWGINVTIPYKQTVMPFLDIIDPPAKKIGAVNTVVNKGGKLFGYNTDYYGLKKLITRNKSDFTDKTALILGTGGTSNTAKQVLSDLGVKEIYKVSRHPKSDEIDYFSALNDKNYAQIIINTTPAGMFPKTDGSAIDINMFKNLELVIDAVYNPLRTDLILSAQKKGIPAEGGFYMLVAQAVCASQYFFDTEYEQDLTDEIYKSVKSGLQNIVLTGMPASGKTTIGKVLSEKLGMPFYDTDELIENRERKRISEIFSMCGEEGFRNIESEVIADVSLKNGCIIATGGGAVLREDNIRRLSHNGIICFLDRPLNELIPTDDRPLACDFKSIEKRYNERIDIYNNTCDFKVPVIGAEVTADKIIKEFNDDSFNKKGESLRKNKRSAF